MNVYSSIQDFQPTKKNIVTIGTFDGVHHGHQKILRHLVEEGQNLQLETIVLTFATHPRKVLQNDDELKLLSSTLEKQQLIERLGIDHLIIHPFDKKFSELSGEDFVKTILVDQLNIQKIIIGYDHRFGKNRSCDYNDLVAFGKKFGFEVAQISAKEIQEISISSTKIRQAIAQHNIRLANSYLGRPYVFSGQVVLGKQLGRTIQFPTANLILNEPNKLIPPLGVYAVKGIWDNQSHLGMMNIGNRPTVNGKETSIEVHFFNLNENLYDKFIEIEIHEFIREEQKFESLDQLKNQLQKDQEFCKHFFKT